MKIGRFAPLLLLLVLCITPLRTVEARGAAAAVVQQGDIASKAPAVILLMRHAEKPLTDSKDPNLSPEGFKRAQALPKLFLDGTLPKPDFLFATAPSKHSNRPEETIAPLAQTLNLKINNDYEDIEADPLAKKILGGKYAGKVVVIAWHHGEIPNVARALGVTDAPKKWDSDVFDQIWKIQYVDGKAVMTVLHEHLMPGDSQ
jgi:hypothetical protein